MPVEMMHLITDEISLLKEPYKGLLYLALACKSLKAIVLPRLYDKDAKDSLKLDHQQPLALQWATWFGALETAKGSLEALERTGTNVEDKINQPFQNDRLYTLRYKTVQRTGPLGPAYGYLHWGSRSGLLHLACLCGNTAIATLLLDNGFKPNTPDGKRIPPLAYALNEDVVSVADVFGSVGNLQGSHDKLTNTSGQTAHQQRSGRRCHTRHRRNSFMPSRFLGTNG